MNLATKRASDSCVDPTLAIPRDCEIHQYPSGLVRCVKGGHSSVVNSSNTIMDYIRDTEQTALSKLQWNSTYLTVSQFLKKFSLPQLVKVAVGFYGENAESTLNANQLLCLHSIKSIEKVRGRDNSDKEISILVECKNKVEVRPWNLKDVYESVKELCSAFPRYVRISQGYYNPSTDEEILNVGDKLYLKSIAKSKKGKEKLICVNQNGQTIELPKDCTGGFQPLTDGKEYYLSEVVKKFAMPVYVQFVDQFGTGEETSSEDKSLCQPLGTIRLQKKNTETVVVATSIRDDGRRSTVTFSRDLDICVVICEDMLKNTTEYAELRQSLSQYVDFQNVSPDIYEYVDAVNSSSKELRLPHSKKPNTKSPRTKDDTKIGGKFNNLLRGYIEGKTSGTSKMKQSDDTQQINSEEIGEIYDDIEPRSTECNKEFVYTELDPIYTSTTSHEYEELLKHDEQRSQKNSATHAVSSTTKESASLHPHLRKLSSTTDSNQPDESESNSHYYGSRNPPPVPMKPSLRSSKSTLPENPQLCDSPPPIPTRPQVLDKPPQLPRRLGAPDKKPTAPDNKPGLPDGNPTTPYQHIPVSESRTTHDSKTACPASPLQLPDRCEETIEIYTVHDNVPSLLTSPSEGPASLPISEKPAITPELQNVENHEAIEKFPSDLSSLSVADVSTLLKYLGMESYVEIFQAELVDGEMLASMDRESLESLNIKAFHVKKLLKFVGGWRPNV